MNHLYATQICRWKQARKPPEADCFPIFAWQPLSPYPATIAAATDVISNPKFDATYQQAMNRKHAEHHCQESSQQNEKLVKEFTKSMTFAQENSKHCCFRVNLLVDVQTVCVYFKG